MNHMQNKLRPMGQLRLRSSWFHFNVYGHSMTISLCIGDIDYGNSIVIIWHGSVTKNLGLETNVHNSCAAY